MKLRSRVVCFIAGAAALGAAPGALGAGRLVDDIQVSKRGEQVSITVELACPMRFASDARTQEGMQVEIRVKPLEACSQFGISDISSEVYRPVGGRLAQLSEVEYESLGLGDNLLIFHFDQPVDYRVAQRGDLRTLQLIVRLPAAQGDGVSTLESQAAPPGKASTPSSAAPSAAPAAAAHTAATIARSPSDRAPLSQRLRAPAANADYIVNLVSQREPFAPTTIESLAAASGHKPYVSEAKVDGQTWYRLRIGFFGTEQEARATLEPLLQQFPKAWVGRAEAAEVQLASSSSFGAGALVPASAAQASEPVAVATPVPATDVAALTPEQIAELQQQGRDAMLAADYVSAIRIYTRLLQEPGDQRPDAREYLGLARERSGQTAQAMAEYRAYLADYPDGDGARRVQQRLNGLTMAAPVPREALRPIDTGEQSAWNVTTGLSQYYRRDVYQFDEFEPQVVALDALLTDIDVKVRHNGDTVNVAGRLVVSNIYDLSGIQQTTIGSLPDTPNRFSYAYVDVNQVDGAWQLRTGRQTLHNWGILGRFDGLHFAYSWAPDRRVHFFSGYPVESTRYGLETSREFYGVAVDFDHLIGRWGFSASLNTGTIDSINDRQSFGLEARYSDDKRSVTSMVDYDYGYDKLNTALVLGTWRFDNRLTLTGLVDVRQSPILTTRNALIAQPVTTISNMLLVWTEDEIRQIARDRTSDMTTVTLGVSKPLFQRFQLNADVTATEIGATVASAGVPAIPSTGQQVYYTTSFVGSGLFGTGDVNVFNLRYGTAPDFTLSQVTWDVRFPVGHRLRLNPRLTYGVWDGSNGVRRETTSPSFRVLLNFRNRYHFEAEVGKDDFLRTVLADPTIRENSIGNYINVGYTADF
jgi:tetratricopeptide (TPR) repeat protein